MRADMPQDPGKAVRHGFSDYFFQLPHVAVGSRGRVKGTVLFCEPGGSRADPRALEAIIRRSLDRSNDARVFFLFLLLVFLSAPPGQAQEPPPNNSCVSCHADDIWQDVKDSVHAQQGIYCHQCHGGDPAQSDKDLAKAPGTGYIGIPEKVQIAEMCGNCHADVETMNFYGIPTDQLARYKTSRHGKKLFLEGDTNVAVCSDCHGYHDVLSVSHSNNPVYPANLPETCNSCHGNEKLMAPYGKPTDIFEKYKNSVHGKALFEKQDLGVATCVSCHGNHGAVPPGVSDVGAACGKCHINERTNFLESVHARIADQSQFPQCIACHSNHDIQPPTLDLYTEACGKCHEPQSQAFQDGQRIWQTMKQAEGALKETQELVRRAGIDGIFVEDDEALLQEVKTKVFEMAPLQHTLSYEKINGVYQEVDQKIKTIHQNVRHKRQSLKYRKMALLPLWVFIGIMIWALWTKYQQLASLKKGNEKKSDG